MAAFESWCQKRQEKLLVPGMAATMGHESAGVILQSAGGKSRIDVRLVIGDQRIELHVCKHCGCIFAQPKGA